MVDGLRADDCETGRVPWSKMSRFDVSNNVDSPSITISILDPVLTSYSSFYGLHTHTLLIFGQVGWLVGSRPQTYAAKWGRHVITIRSGD